MASSRPSAIVSLDDYQESINIIIYGDSGIGKTVFAGTCEEGLFLGTETGAISAKRQGSQAELWPIDDWDDLVAAYDYLKNEDHPYRWVMIDSVTEMQEKARQWILNRAVEENDSRDPDLFAIQDYQKWYNMYKRFVRAFNALPVNVLYTALPYRVEVETDDDLEPLVLPLIEGKGFQYAQWTCAQMHVVGYYGKRMVGKGDERREVRRMLFQNTPPYFAKDRYDALGRYIDEPTMPLIEGLIDGSAEHPHAAKKTAAKKTAGKKTTAAAAS